jgi:SAM-dependent methyltransferase
MKPTATARLPQTPLDALGPTVRDTVTVSSRTFILTRPDAVDRLLDHPGFAGAVEEYLPLWAHLWPAARLLAEVVRSEPWASGESLSALELGCGLGLPGLAALSRGLRVTFSDYDATALSFAADNAGINGFAEFETLHMDWRWPAANLSFPVLLAADLLHEAALVRPLAELIRAALAPDGLCLLANGDRVALQALPPALDALGLGLSRVAVQVAGTGSGLGPTFLYRIRHAARE